MVQVGDGGCWDRHEQVQGSFSQIICCFTCTPNKFIADDIAKLGDWSNASTFYKFYKKEAHIRSTENFTQNAILSLS